MTLLLVLSPVFIGHHTLVVVTVGGRLGVAVLVSADKLTCDLLRVISDGLWFYVVTDLLNSSVRVVSATQEGLSWLRLPLFFTLEY